VRGRIPRAELANLDAVSGVVYDRDDVRAHGKDERERVDRFLGAVDFYYRFLKGVTAE